VAISCDIGVNRDLRVLIRYGVALAAVAFALAIKRAFDGLGADHPFILLPAAVIVSAWYGGRGPGLLAAVISAIGADVLFLPPAGIGVLKDDIFPLVALLAEAILIVEITVRLRKTREVARREAASAEVARREASFGLHMREELLTFLSTKLNRPLIGMVDGLISARSAVERGQTTQAMAALDNLATEVRLFQRTTEHWVSSTESDFDRGPVERD
jgi:K+-sensing histidine kinase KdpD